MDPSGQWLASGGDDGTLRLWEARTGRCLRTWALGGKVACVAWCPAPAMRLLSAAVGKAVLLLPSGAPHSVAVCRASLVDNLVPRARPAPALRRGRQGGAAAAVGCVAPHGCLTT